MTAIGEWLDARRTWPWPTEPRDVYGRPPGGNAYPVAAGELYAAYRNGGGDLSPREFGMAIVAHANPDGSPAFTRRRAPEGNVYDGISLRTRRQRFEDDVTFEVVEPYLTRLRVESEERHAVAVHADGSPCEHRMPESVRIEQRAAAEAAATADGQLDPARIAATVESRFGPWLAWQPGDPNPQRALDVARFGQQEVERREAEAARIRETMAPALAGLRALDQEGSGQSDGW